MTPTTETASSQELAVPAILTTWSSATPEQRHEARSWYPRERRRLRRLATRHGSTLGACCGAAAALSPITSWQQTLARLELLLLDRSASVHTSHQLAKAVAILDGARPLAILNGPKETPFYRQLMTGGTFPTPVIDRHAARLALQDASLVAITRHQLQLAADAYTRAAQLLQELPAHVQALSYVLGRRSI